MFRIGQGVDIHKFKVGKFIKIGGVTIPHTRGIKAHSDGDLLIHAVLDAILGALAMGDIGKYFPDDDDRYKNMSSSYFLQRGKMLLEEKSYKISNIDATIISEEPKFAPYLDIICENMTNLLELDLDRFNLKATTSEKMGFIGKGQGLAALATVLLIKKE